MKKWLIVLFIVVFTIMTAQGAEPKVTIICDDADAQFEAISPDGIRVLMDIANPGLLSSPVVAKDILVTTHSHADHYRSNFVDSFPGQQLKIKAGVLQTDGVQVTGIASAHSASGEFLPEGGSNYIYLIEMGNLRIAHFGDIGQEKLTEDQLKALGEIDVAITQLSNSFSAMNIQNLKGFNLMDQVNPKLILLTHIDEATAKYAAQKWESFYITGPLKISKADLTGGKTKILFMESWGKISKGMKIAKKWQ
jgi:L-ascorbate metabolism protein UlaG (beta-lactamase superfamily)